MRGARFWSCQDVPAPALTASIITRGSMPERAASTSASQTPRLVSATATWLHSFTVWPAPLGPQCTIFRPIASSTAR